MTHQPGERDRPQADLAAGFAEQPLRHFVLSEIHARPFQAMSTPRRVLHYAFATNAAAAELARDQLSERCNALGVDAPDSDSSHHIVIIGDARLRWETHSEFTTYTWDMPPDEGGRMPTFGELLSGEFVQPGPLLVASRLDLVEDHRETQQLLEGLDPGTTAVSSLREGRAIGATDFRLHEHGMTRILLVDRGLYKHEIGPMVVRLMELETYRTMALLGLPEARALQPSLSRAEAGLQEVTTKIGSTSDITENRALLDSLTTLAGELEAAHFVSARLALTMQSCKCALPRSGKLRLRVTPGGVRSCRGGWHRRYAPASAPRSARTRSLTAWREPPTSCAPASRSISSSRIVNCWRR